MATFWATFVKFGLLFISTPGHTEREREREREKGERTREIVCKAIHPSSSRCLLDAFR